MIVNMVVDLSHSFSTENEAALLSAAGLGWLAANALAARRHRDAARAFPPRLIVLHGLAAAATLALTVLTALTAGHG